MIYPAVTLRKNENENCLSQINVDLQYGNDYKFYDIPVTNEFENYIQQKTGYTNAKRGSSTDIVILCANSKSCCGVNLSVGYYEEYSSSENLNIEEWRNTLEIVEKILVKPLKLFPLKG